MYIANLIMLLIFVFLAIQGTCQRFTTKPKEKKTQPVESISDTLNAKSAEIIGKLSASIRSISGETNVPSTKKEKTERKPS